jgi:hypothetical protein
MMPIEALEVFYGIAFILRGGVFSGAAIFCGVKVADLPIDPILRVWHV